MSLKQVILVRQDLKLSKGKMAAQASHASVDAVLKADESVVKRWREAGMKKVVLKVPDEKTLVEFFQRAKSEGLPSALITDAGHTHVAPGTKTCVGVGPADEEEVDSVTGDLKLVS